MSRFNKAAFRQTGAILGAVGLTAVAWHAVGQIARADAFSKYRSSSEARPEGVTIRNLDMYAYEGSRLVTHAVVGEASVERDRSSVTLSKVTDGVYYAAEDQSFGFEAESANYGYFTRQLDAHAGARVTGEEMDLRTAAFSYDERDGLLLIPAGVSGGLQGGTLEATSLTYRVRDETFLLGPLTWTGEIQEAPVQATRRKWTFKTEGVTTSKGPISTYQQATATDGEVIVRAKTVEYNRETDVLTATGDVRYFGQDANMACAKVVIYSKERRSVATGSVQMLIKPEADTTLKEVEIPPLQPVVPEDVAASRPPAPDTSQRKQEEEQVRSTENLRAYPVRLTAERIEYWYRKGERRGTITGSPQARQELGDGKWRMVWAASGQYDGEKDTLRLQSREGQKDARMKNSLGDDLRAAWFVISTKKDEDEWSASGLVGDVYVEDDEVPRRSGDNGGGRPSMSGPIGRRA